MRHGRVARLRRCRPDYQQHRRRVQPRFRGTIGTRDATNGATGGYTAVTPVSLGGGNAINVTLTYDLATLTLIETLTDAVNGNTKTLTYTGVNLQTLLGDSAYLGFTGGSGTLLATQKISNFRFTPAATNRPGQRRPGQRRYEFDLAIAGPRRSAT